MDGAGFSSTIDDDAQGRTVRKTMEMLESPTADGTSLHGEIPRQMYEDVFIRLAAITAGPTLLVFLCDDYLESMIDMKRSSLMLARDPRPILLASAGADPSACGRGLVRPHDHATVFRSIGAGAVPSPPNAVWG